MPPRINTTALQLTTTQPFDFAATVHSHGWVALAPHRWESARALWRRPEQLHSGKVVLIHARGGRAGRRAAVDLEVNHPGRLSVAERDQVLARVSHMLRLDEDLSAFYRLCRDAGPRRGTGRLLRSPTLFEDLVKTLCTTNIQWGGTKRMVAALVETYGADYAGEAGCKAFPTAQAIAAESPARFKKRVNLGYRSDYVHLLARRITAGDLDLNSLWDPQLDTAEVRKRLLAIKGVGAYAAATLLMLLGHYDQLPVDSVFRDFVRRSYFNGEAISDAQAQAVYDDWGRWKYLAYWHDVWPGDGAVV